MHIDAESFVVTVDACPVRGFASHAGAAHRGQDRGDDLVAQGGQLVEDAVAARLALDTLTLRAGEVEAALSLGLSERDSRMEIIGQSATNALLPNLDSTRTVGLVTLPGAFVGVLLSTGSAAPGRCRANP